MLRRCLNLFSLDESGAEVVLKALLKFVVTDVVMGSEHILVE